LLGTALIVRLLGTFAPAVASKFVGAFCVAYLSVVGPKNDRQIKIQAGPPAAWPPKIGAVGEKMAHPGDLFNWTAGLLLGLVALWVVWSFTFSSGNGEPIIQVVPLLLVGSIWLLARLFRS
jgi:hypothetical protein